MSLAGDDEMPEADSDDAEVSGALIDTASADINAQDAEIDRDRETMNVNGFVAEGDPELDDVANELDKDEEAIEDQEPGNSRTAEEIQEAYAAFEARAQLMLEPTA